VRAVFEYLLGGGIVLVGVALASLLKSGKDTRQEEREFGYDRQAMVEQLEILKVQRQKALDAREVAEIEAKLKQCLKQPQRTLILPPGVIYTSIPLHKPQEESEAPEEQETTTVWAGDGTHFEVPSTPQKPFNEYSHPHLKPEDREWLRSAYDGEPKADDDGWHRG
jgi:hypothetical protein